MLCARIGTGSTYRVFCMVTVTESHTFRSLNEPCPLQKRTTDVCKNGDTSVVQVNTVAWAREVIVYSCARSSGNQVVVG